MREWPPLPISQQRNRQWNAGLREFKRRKSRGRWEEKKNFLNNSENSLAGKEQQVNSITVQQLYST